MEHSIPAISPPHVSKSCRQSLHFNLENENDVFSVGAEEVIRDHVTHGYNKFLSNPLDNVNEQAVDTNSSIGLEDNLEAESTSQPNLNDGFVAMRGYERKQRAPRPLHDRFHSYKYGEI